jgi:hypothetical protein
VKWQPNWELVQVVIQFCKGDCEDRASAREAEESRLLEAVAREQLVEETAGWKRLNGCCVDLELERLEIAL